MMRIPFFVWLLAESSDSKNIYLVLEMCNDSLKSFVATKNLSKNHIMEIVL